MPESYVELFDKILEDDVDGGLGKISQRGLNHLFAAARISSEQRDRILQLVSPGGGKVGRNEFNVLLALVGLVQEGETVSLDAVDERRRGEFALSMIHFLCLYVLFSQLPFSHIVPCYASPHFPACDAAQAVPALDFWSCLGPGVIFQVDNPSHPLSSSRKRMPNARPRNSSFIIQ